VGGQPKAPAVLPPGKETQYQTYRRLGLGGCGKCRAQWD